MGHHLETELRHLSKRLRKWIFIALSCALYLLADWTLLRTTQQGGYLSASLGSYAPQSLAVLEYHESDEGNYVTIVEQSGNYYNSRVIASPETIIIYQNVYAPFWALTRKIYPRTAYAIHNYGNQLPIDLIERTTEAASLVSLDEAERLKHLLLISNQPPKTVWSGRVRNVVALVMLLVFAINSLLILGIFARIRTVNRSLKLSRCTCGYDLVGLTTEICPECGRATLSPKPGQSSTMDS